MQPAYEITFHPVDLTVHGTNPYGQPVYRVVWADSRKSKVMCRGKIHFLPRYHHGDEANAAGHWVLEKWAPAETILKLTRDQYEGLIAAIPGAAAEEYSEHGDYELSYVFADMVDEVFLHKQLAMHEFRIKHRTDGQVKTEVEEAEDQKEKQQEATIDALFDAAREDTLCH